MYGTYGPYRYVLSVVTIRPNWKRRAQPATWVLHAVVVRRFQQYASWLLTSAIGACVQDVVDGRLGTLAPVCHPLTVTGAETEAWGTCSRIYFEAPN